MGDDASGGVGVGVSSCVITLVLLETFFLFALPNDLFGFVVFFWGVFVSNSKSQVSIEEIPPATSQVYFCHEQGRFS